MLYDVASLWSAVHAWAGKHGFETAIPTFEAGNSANGPVFGVIAFDQGLPWLRADSMPCTEAYEQPTPGFSDAGAVVRNVGRWASTTGAARWDRAVLTGWPSFQVPLQPEPVTQASLPVDPEGRANGEFAIYLVDAGQQGIYWQDIAAEEYLNVL
ncbi:hypothetical protein IV500_17640 [Paeniglutamicibacter antarcticus]|uniref:Uncharacterized protein n=1 Tax=Arthrobacter terrae TaxID=2935737 RepID=A0A931G6M2_9MICC|nr:hypothetical protein [Arthrobacter terrae]MBG0741193.1 hypothetical protein [Arthrobacter terrae]